MAHIRRTPYALALAVVAVVGVSGGRPLAQENRDVKAFEEELLKKNLPNPYQPGSDGWAKLPEGRKWGAPSKVALDKDGKSLWVAERCGGDAFGCLNSPLAPVLKFEASGKLVTSFGEGKFVFPHGLTVDRDGNVWSTDGNGKDGKGHLVYKYSPDGKLLLTLGKAGVAGDGPDTFNQPTDVVVASNGDIFVADGHIPVKTPRIVKFSKDGTFIKAWGKFGSAPGELQDPHCIAMDSRGRIFVCDRRNDRVQIFDQDGNYVDAWKQFGRPSGIFISNDDTIYVAEQELGIIIGSAKDGSLKAYVPVPIPPPGQRRRGAESVAVDSTGNMYGGEIGALRLMRYVKK